MTTATKSHQTINPKTEEVIETYEILSPSETKATIQRGHEAFTSWKLVSLSERAEVIAKIGERIRQESEPLAKLMQTEMGKSLEEAKQEVELCAGICDYTAKNGPTQLKDEKRPLDGGRAIVAHRPLGLIFGIQPWNFPLYQVVRYSIPNLMAGNGILLKHAQNVWGMGQKIAQLYAQAGLPENLFQHMCIDHDQTELVMKHDLVRGVTFTGSASAGGKIAEIAAGALKKTVLELGSNDAYLILADADLEKAVPACVQGRLNNVGQTCVAAKRFIVEDKVYDAFREKFVEAMGQTELAPMARGDLRETLHDQVKESTKKGARCLLGGELPSGKGFFYPATVLENVKPGMPAYDGELFGPVASLIRAKDAEDAMRIANDSRFGLGGGIFSADEEKAITLALDHFDTGMINVNGYHLAQPSLPFGGVKDSGYGREHGGFGIKEFVNIKSVMITE